MSLFQAAPSRYEASRCFRNNSSVLPRFHQVLTFLFQNAPSLYEATRCFRNSSNVSLHSRQDLLFPFQAVPSLCEASHYLQNNSSEPFFHLLPYPSYANRYISLRSSRSKTSAQFSLLPLCPFCAIRYKLFRSCNTYNRRFPSPSRSLQPQLYLRHRHRCFFYLP